MNIKYIIVIGNSVYNLAILVNESINEGFIPYGGITYREKLPQGFKAEYYQAMFKPEPLNG